MRLSSQREGLARQLTWRRRLRNGGGGSNHDKDAETMTMQKQQRCGDNDDKNISGGESQEQCGKGSRRQWWG
jgi:hypothetical protein